MRYLAFASSPQAQWRGNFSRAWRLGDPHGDPSPSRGRITLDVVDEEISRLSESWQINDPLPAVIDEIDLFDRRQLETVLEVCRRSASLSEAGRELFAVSPAEKGQSE